jgi:acetyltransferase
MFEPRTIAIVGASNAPQKPGYNIMQSLMSFPGEVFPVNPRDSEVCGIKAYPSLNDIGNAIDLVIFAIPAKAIIAALDEATVDIGGCLIVSSGFEETGGEGSNRQDELRELCRKRGIRVIGPNTAGLMNPAHKLSATFVPGTDALRPGTVGIVSQSGAINMIFSFMAHQSHLGISLAVGLGNMMDVAHDHVVSYLADDEQTKVILLYAEGIVRGRELFDAIRHTTEKKPVVVLLVGKTDIAEFAASHTGNLIGSYALKKSALEQAGAVVVESVTEAIDAANVFSRYRMPPGPAPGIGLVTAQAGPGMVMMDVLGENGIDVPRLTPNTVDEIGKLLPPLTYIENPVDTGRPSATFADILRCVSEDESIDAMLTFSLDEPDTIQPQIVLEDLRSNIKVPLMFGTVGIEASEIGKTIAETSALGIPAFDSPERLATAGVALVQDAKRRAAAQEASEFPEQARSWALPEPESRPNEMQVKDMLNDIGFSVPSGRACLNRTQAEKALSEVGQADRRKSPGREHRAQE